MHNLALAQTIPQNSKLIVGFSGGPDSVFLLTQLCKIQNNLNLTIIAAHLDHQWRTESTKDAAWCKKFCSAYPNVTFVSATSTELNFTGKNNGSKEELGRKMRRAFFEQLTCQYQADYIVLAHHCNDQIENFFIRLIRSSSLTGLASMKEQDGIYLKPLLNISKQKILQYLEEHKIEYLKDPSNLDPVFLRNNIRHNLIPKLYQIDARFEQSMIKTIANLQETEDFIRQETQLNMQKICDPKERYKLNITEFLKLHPVLQHRILLQMLIDQKISFTPSQPFFAEIKRFLTNTKSNLHQISHLAIIVKQKNYFFFKSL